MDRSKHKIICNKHPNEIPQPGVCPSCLRERLSRIIATGQQHSRTTSSVINTWSSSSSFSPPIHDAYHYNDYSSASNISPKVRHRGREHRRVASDVLDSVYLAFKGNSMGLKKSRSIAFAARNVDNDEVRDCRTVDTKMMMKKEKKKKKKKKKGFWNKLRASVGKIKL